MPYYQGDYYQGDYYQGDFWGKLGKGVRRVGRNLRKGLKFVAPIAAAVLPFAGAATLAGRAYSAHRKLTTARDVIRGRMTPEAMMATMDQPTLEGIRTPSSRSTTAAARTTRRIRHARKRRTTVRAARRHYRRRRRARQRS